MSGGSFDYLCYKDINDLMTLENSILEMADELAQLGYAEDASRATMDLLLEIRRASVHMQAMKDKLEPVWKSIEWWQSGDSTEQDFKDTLREYRNQGDAK